MEKFKQKKIVIILDKILVVFAILFIVSFVLTFLLENTFFIYGLLVSIIISFASIIISTRLSEKDKYTKDFLKYINSKIEKANTLQEYKDISSEFEYLAIEDKRYNLSFPNDLRYTHNRILNSIEALERKDKQIL